MGKIKFVVVDENVLGFINPAYPEYVEVLHAPIDTIKGRLFWYGHKLRPATRQDFVDYNVSFECYLKNPERYNFPAN